MLEKLKKLKVNIGWKSLILIGVCVVLVLVDLLTKFFEEKDKWQFTVIPKFIEVSYGSRNPGCAFSFLAEAAWGQTFLIVMTFIMLALLIAVFIILPERFILLKVSISMIVAGAIGNLVDRIAFHEVRDFVSINMLFTTAVCNFADFWIVIGTVIAIVDILFVNELSLIPLTKSAKEAQAKRALQEKQLKEAESAQTSENAETSENAAAEIPEASDTNVNENTEHGKDGENG